MANSRLPDRLIGRITGEGSFEIHTWLRMEHLAEDFLDFVCQFTDVSDEQRARTRTLKLGDKIASYDHDPSHWFTREQMERLYRGNPVWSAIEEEVYGALSVA